MAIVPSIAPDDPIARDGDGGFFGLNMRNNPELLQAGELQRAENLRLDRGVVSVRNGARSRAERIQGTAPLVLNFTLGADLSISSITRSGTTATVTTGSAHGLTVGKVVNIRSTGKAAYDRDFFVLTTPTTTTFTIAVIGAPANVSGAGYVNAGPVLGTGTTIPPVLAAARYVNALASGKPEFVVLVTASRSYLYQEGVPGTPVVEYPDGETVETTDEVSIVQALDRLYLFRAPQESEEFAPFTITQLVRDGTTATATAPGHWLQVGQRVRITGAGQEAYNHEFDIIARDDDSFSFTVAHSPVTPATAASGPIRAQRVKPPLFWDGVAGEWQRAPGGSHPAGATFSRMPGNVIAAVYFNNQLGVARSKDEWGFSDVLDPDTFDFYGKSFRTGSGGNDYIVGAHPFADRDLLVFCRYSVWRVHIELTEDGQSVDPLTSNIALLTSEIGCRARDSIATVRQYVYFLSDAGVYRIDPNFTEQRLRELSSLLSDPVLPITQRIEWGSADRASAAFYDSRYWLLVQRDDQTSPNMLLVFSLLNEAWESVDLFDGLDGVQLVTARYQNRERLFCAGGDDVLCLLDDRADGDGLGGTVAPIVGVAGTRRFVLGLPFDEKRFLRFKAGVHLPASGRCVVRASTHEPEKTFTLSDFTATTAEDYALKLPILARAQSIDFEIELTGPGAQLRNVAVEAAGHSSPPEQRTRTTS